MLKQTLKTQEPQDASRSPSVGHRRVGGEQNILPDRHVREESKVLGNIANPSLFRTQPDSLGRIEQRARANAQLPLRRLDKAGERLEKKTLSRAGWTQNSHTAANCSKVDIEAEIAKI